MKNIILTITLLSSTLASAAQVPASIIKAQDGGTLSYSELYTESAWQALTLDAAAVGLTGSNSADVTGALTLTNDAGLDVTLDAATLNGRNVVLNVTVARPDTSVAFNRTVTFTLTNAATGQQATFTAPVLGAAQIDPASIQTIWVE